MLVREESGPLEVRRKIGKILRRHGMVARFRTAALHAIHGSLGQGGFELEHGGRFGFRVPSSVQRFGEQVEHIGHVLFVFFAQVD